MKKKGNLVDIHSREIYPATLTIESGIIRSIERNNERYDSFIIPGFLDSHIHIESSMITPGAFAVMAVKHGTIGTISDPHEIANVLGIEGLEFMIRDGKKVPFYFWFGAPSCVPATEFETSGAKIGAEDIAGLLERDDIKYLSELMNFPGVIYDNKEVISKIRAAVSRGKVVDGHAPELTGERLVKYIAAGISTDHECSTIDEALEKIKLGMKILVREGSAARNLNSLKELIHLHPDRIMLCSDDLHPERLLGGHINRISAKLINDGFDIYDVLRASSLNPVDHYKLESGLLRIGDSADFAVTSNLHEMEILETWIKGNIVYDGKDTCFEYENTVAINKFNCSKISESDIRVKKESDYIRVITAKDGELITGENIERVFGGEFAESNPASDILKIVVKDRYNNKPPAVGFIKGFGLKSGSFGSSVAHDSHNIIAIGTTDREITSCINKIVEMKGGLVVCNGNELDSLELGIGGIMTDKPCKEVAEKYQFLSETVKRLGCKLQAPFMTLSFMALLVIPSLKLSDRGLFDGNKFSFTSLFTM